MSLFFLSSCALRDTCSFEYFGSESLAPSILLVALGHGVSGTQWSATPPQKHPSSVETGDQLFLPPMAPGTSASYSVTGQLL